MFPQYSAYHTPDKVKEQCVEIDAEDIFALIPQREDCEHFTVADDRA